jgi:ferredoxin-NADP reductase
VPVQSVERLTGDSVVITFDVPEELHEEFRFDAGQHLTVRTDLGGERVRRNYSICSPATSGQLRIAVKHISGGAFSTFALERLQAGDVLELMTPTGRFGTALDPLARKNYVAIAAGSGITPVLSVLQTTLEIETESRFTLIYANRSAETTMFKDILDELESRHADRFEVMHVRSRDPLHPPALSGRINRGKIAHWIDSTLTAETVDEWFLCGPVELMTLAREMLLEHHVDPDRIHLELFFGFGKNAAGRQDYAAATVMMRMSDSEQTLELAPGDTILEAALQVRGDVPYACMGGACGTCKSKLVAGSVEMEQNFALTRADLDEGYVLTCQAHPTSPAVTVDYDG